jgi:aminopeptidase N
MSWYIFSSLLKLVMQLGSYVYGPHGLKYMFMVYLVAYLASLNEPDATELALHEYKSATNMTEQFAALAALSQNPGQVREDALLDFYNKWQDDYLVR